MVKRIVPTCAVALVLVLTAILLVRADSVASPNDSYLAHASTDKPIYRVGETVFLRAVLLGANDHKPLKDDSYGLVAITGPSGEVLGNYGAEVKDSVLAFNWQVPDDAGGGQYKATISFPGPGYPPTERTFDVRAYRAPRLKGEIIFLRDGFGPGDSVKASMHVERAEGGLPIGASVQATAVVDGATIYDGPAKVDAAGNVSVAFPLPAEIQRGDGTLTLTVNDGGTVEPISKTIPILLKTIDVNFYPEGGDLVAGLNQRVYVEARTPAHKPADLVGQILDSHGNSVAEFSTEHEGRGRFSFVPKTGEHYALKVSQPAGIDKTFPLPEIVSSGVVLSTAQDTFASGQSLRFSLSATDAGTYQIRLSKHGEEIASLSFPLGAGDTAHPELTPPSWTDGVLVATVTNSHGIPLAERLVFRQPAHSLHVTVTSDTGSYVPGQSVKLTVTTKDDDGNPIAAEVGVNVTDDSVLQMIEKRDRAPRLDSMVLLEDDVKELADAGTYLSASDPKAPLATDLLLGTQGWRRFAFSHPEDFKTREGDRARRVLADLQPQPEIYDAIGGRFGGGGGNMPEGAAVRNGAMRNRMLMLGEADRAGFQFAAVSAPHSMVAALPPPPLADEPVPTAAEKMAMPRPMILPAYTREYAHDLAANRPANSRTDFTETVYWCAGIKTDAKTGTATVSFKLNDSVTTFQASADAFSAGGALGVGQADITSVKPFYVEPKLPLEVSTGDTVQLPIAAVNGTDGTLDVSLSTTAGQGIWVSPVDPFKLGAGQRGRQLVDVKIGAFPGDSSFIIKAEAGAYSDEVTRKLSVKPLGFPTEWARGGTLDADGRISYTINIPKDVVPGSIHTNIAFYPTPLGNLTEALRALLQEPNGCFEQTSSTNYPLVMADQYFLTHTGVDPSLIAQSNELLAKGYDRLIGFECKNKGYEWFGEDPGHECLSAYGLLEFTDMSAVRQVDAGMLADTRAWLMARRDGKGGYTHERRSLHIWITNPGCANGYCTWALLECGQTGLDKEVAWLRQDATADSNSYVVALAANSMYLAGDKPAAKQFMDRLAKQQDKDGHVLGATTSVVGSEGDTLNIETTSLATLAWLRDPAYAGNVESAIRYLADSCKGGRYGSTQSTVLALRAIIAYDKSRSHPTVPGKVQLMLDGKPVGDAAAFDTTTQGAIHLPDIAPLLTPGGHVIELAMTAGSNLPFAAAVNYNSVTPDSSNNCKLGLAVSLKDGQLSEGAPTEADVTVTNRTAETLPSPIAIIGLPGGLEVRQDQLKELVKSDRIAAYEVRGREVILYWRDMQPSAQLDIPLSVIAAVPGHYTGPASRAYLYYVDDAKQWTPGLEVSIAPK